METVELVTVLRMLAPKAGQTERLASMDLRETSNDRDQLARSRHSKAEHGVPTFFAVKGNALDDSSYMFDIGPICARRSFFW